jgi:hypothetical protein
MAETSNLELVRKNVRATQNVVMPGGGNDPNGVTGPTPSAQSQAKAAQSVGQTTAIVIQDAADMLRNVSTIETTAIGAATAAWLATQDPAYALIIETSMSVMEQTAALYLTIGTNAATVLAKFES